MKTKYFKSSFIIAATVLSTVSFANEYYGVLFTQTGPNYWFAISECSGYSSSATVPLPYNKFPVYAVVSTDPVGSSDGTDEEWFLSDFEGTLEAGDSGLYPISHMPYFDGPLYIVDGVFIKP